MLRPRAALQAVVLVTVGALLPAPAGASDVTDVLLYNGANSANTSAEPCTNAPQPPASISAPVPADGGPVARTSLLTGDLLRNSNFSDAMHYELRVSAEGRLTTLGGQPATLSLHGRGAVDVDAAVDPSACRLSADTFIGMEYALAVTTPLILQATVRTTGEQGGGAFTVNRVGSGNLELSLDGRAGQSSSIGRVLLPNGQYDGYAEVLTAYAGSTSDTYVSTADIDVVFHRPGERLTKISGAGKKYVRLPGSRTCPSGGTTVKVTGSAKRAGQIAKLELFVGDKRVKRVSNPKKGKAYELKGSAAADVSVRAVVTLDNGRTKSVRSSYVACTA